MTEGVAQQKWTEIWKLFEPEEQLAACRNYVEHLVKDNDWQSSPVLDRLADASKFRVAEITRLARQNPGKLAELLRPRVSSVLRDQSWPALFRAHYFASKALLMCTFLDQLGVPHNESGGVDEGFGRPAPEKVAPAVDHLLKTYSAQEVCRYLCVLVRMGDSWVDIAAERDRLLALAFGAAQNPPKRLDEKDVTAVADASGEFSVLDRLIIREVVRSVANVEGSLDEDALQDLVETVLRLNDQWYRAYFHLGFMDVLVPSRSLQFDRPEDNDQRRGWYFAGVMAGLARSHAVERLIDLLESHYKDLERCAMSQSGSGAALARVGFRFLIEAGQLNEALLVLRAQLGRVGLALGRDALGAATEFIRDGKYESAKAITDILGPQRIPEQESKDRKDDVERYFLEVERRRGQCLQAAGDFDNAEKAFKKLLDAGEDKSSPDLLADLGLVKGKFRRVDDLALPEAPDRRLNMRDALLRGKSQFDRAIDLFGANSPKAAYALAVLDYLRWSFEGDKSAQKESRREAAATSVRRAIAAIRQSSFEAVYRDIGALGQCQFMLAVLLLNGLDAVEGRDAATAWSSITESAGRFPEIDLRALLSGAEVHDSAVALEIAESIWEHRGRDALGFLAEGPWISSSPRLRKEILTIAGSTSTPRAERVRLWTAIIPALIRANETDSAEEGLAQLEVLAEDPQLTGTVHAFLEISSNFDPAWSAVEAGWARVGLLRRMGKDWDCGHELRKLFYLVRDDEDEAQQIVELFAEWGLDSALRDEIAARLPVVAPIESRGIVERLSAGEPVALAFFGGNEVQARYDESVKEELAREWPGVRVQFEHSAWSSNWGRESGRYLAAANASDAVVLHRFMRTMLGRTLRAGLQKPWIACVGSGRGSILGSLRRAAVVGLEQRMKRGAARS